MSPRKGVLEEECAVGAEFPECVNVDVMVLAAEDSSGDADAHEELLEALSLVLVLDHVGKFVDGKVCGQDVEELSF